MPRRVYRRKSTKGRKLSKRQYKQVKSIVNGTIEPKFLDHTINTTVSTSGFVNGFTAISQGDAESERVGNDIQVKRLNLRFQLCNADDTNIIRVIMFQWFPNTTPVVASLLTLTSGYEVLANYNEANKSEYRIITDRTYQLVAPYSSGSDCKRYTMSLSPRLRKTEYNPGVTTGSGLIYMCAVSDSSAVTHPQIIVNARVHYQDN